MWKETGNVPVSPMPSQALPEQSFLWRRTARRQPEPTVSTATAEAPVQWYSNPAVTAEASVNGYSRRNIWQFLLDSLSLPGQSIDPNQLSFNSGVAHFSANASESSLPLIFFQHTCSPSKLHATATRESSVDTVLEGWVSLPCKGETSASKCGAAATPHGGWNAVMTVALGCSCTTKSTLGSISRRTKTEARYHPTAQKEQIRL